MDKTVFKGFYTGCLNCGNVGDEILLPIFIKMFSETLRKYFIIDVEDSEEIFDDLVAKEWIEQCQIGVVGGGLLLHAEEISYTNIIKLNNLKTRFICGSGISDSPNFKIDEKNLKFLLNKEYDKFVFPTNNFFKFNIDVVGSANGGLRGPIDIMIAKNNKEGFNRPFIYDIGMMANKFLNKKSKGVFVKELFGLDVNIDKIITINLASITGTNAIGINNVSDFNNKIYNYIKEFCLFLLSQEYKIVFCPFGAELHLHKTLINSIINYDENYKNSLFCSNLTLTYEQILDIFSSSYLVLGSRLHASVLAASCGTPHINIAYNYKCLNFEESISMIDYTISTNIINLEKTLDCFYKIQEKYDQIKKEIEKHILRAEELYGLELEKTIKELDINLDNSIKYKLQWNRGDGKIAHIAKFKLSKI